MRSPAKAMHEATMRRKASHFATSLNNVSSISWQTEYMGVE